MSLAELLLEIRPRQLERARELVIAVHPSTAAVPVAVAAEALPALRRRVAAVSGQPALLERLAFELTPREVRGLATGLTQWPELRADVASLLLLRGRADLVAPLWRAWQNFPLDGEVRRILLALADRFGWQAAVPPMLHAWVDGWVAADAPGVEIVGRLALLQRSYSDLAREWPTLITADTPLLRLVRDAVLTHGTTAQLRAEGGTQLWQWSRELAPLGWILFGRNYLSQLPAVEWHQPIVNRIAQSYGLPRRPRLPEFWQEVPADAQAAFQRLFVRDRIQRAFKDDTDRHGYWMRWEASFDDIEFGRAGTTDYAVLHFDRFAVVEFFEVGHAAYFYDPTKLADVMRIPAREPGGRKVMYHPFGREDNRLLHMPSGGWYGKADRMVRQWIRLTR